MSKMGVKSNIESESENKSVRTSTNIENTKSNNDTDQAEKNSGRELKTQPIYWPKVVKSPHKRRGLGVRKTRRHENTCFLLSLVDNEEYGELELSLSDLVKSQNAFEQLFENQESMEIWNDFMNRSGEEQERYLKSMTANDDDVFNEGDEEKNNDKANEDIDSNDNIEILDKRSEHPAHTPEECFQRINPKNRTMLRRRHIPKGSVKLHEEELVSWFSDDPTSVFVSMLPSSYDRLLLHSVCQYLDLQSTSYDFGGQRQTRVENTHDFFEPPPMLLSKYLDSMS